MFVTTRYVGTRYIGMRQGNLKYLFFLLTEDYITDNRKIMESLSPLLTKFARDLGGYGGVVQPFHGDEQGTLGDVLQKGWHTDNDMVMWMRSKLPALLVTDVDFDDFDPHGSNYILISLRDCMDSFGNVEVFTLQKLFSQLIIGVKGNNLFGAIREYFAACEKDEALELAWDAVELKPGIFGIRVDLKKALQSFAKLIMR